MSTEKRQRQKAARRARLAAEAKARKRKQTLRRGGIGVVILALIVALSVWLSGGSPKKAASTTTSTTSPFAAAQLAADRASAAAGCPSSTSAKLTKPSWPSPPPMTIDPSKHYTATVKTDVGTFVITLDPTEAPKTVNNFVFLAQHQFYNCVIFHRVIPGFMDQTGDPTGTGTGGPGYKFADELPPKATPQYPIGSVAMANSGPNTNGSQFFIVTGPQGESLPPSYSLFGTVTSGMSVVQKINADGSAQGVPPNVTHRMLSVTIQQS
ncbi:MAG: peptidylprolyl isomerase [Actinomycetota bacterium]|nr:peptidylprolyl isomerase [Actinomycetota bacterium]